MPRATAEELCELMDLFVAELARRMAEPDKLDAATRNVIRQFLRDQGISEGIASRPRGAEAIGRMRGAIIRRDPDTGEKL